MVVLPPTHSDGEELPAAEWNLLLAAMQAFEASVSTLATGLPFVPIAESVSDPTAFTGTTAQIYNVGGDLFWRRGTDYGGDIFQIGEGFVEPATHALNMGDQEIRNIGLGFSTSSGSFRFLFSDTLTVALDILPTGIFLNRFALPTGPFLLNFPYTTTPTAPSSGRAALYFKSSDKRLYYMDDSGAEIGPLTTGGGVQTSDLDMNSNNILNVPSLSNANGVIAMALGGFAFDGGGPASFIHMDAADADLGFPSPFGAGGGFTWAKTSLGNATTQGRARMYLMAGIDSTPRSAALRLDAETMFMLEDATADPPSPPIAGDISVYCKAGKLYWRDFSGVVFPANDNLGDHTATQDIDLDSNDIINVANVRSPPGVSMGIGLDSGLAFLAFLSGSNTVDLTAAAGTFSFGSVGIRFPTGTPGAVADGALWYDGANFKVRLAGVTKTVTVT